MTVAGLCALEPTPRGGGGPRSLLVLSTESDLIARNRDKYRMPFNRPRVPTETDNERGREREILIRRDIIVSVLLTLLTERRRLEI